MTNPKTDAQGAPMVRMSYQQHMRLMHELDTLRAENAKLRAYTTPNPIDDYAKSGAVVLLHFENAEPISARWTDDYGGCWLVAHYYTGGHVSLSDHYNIIGYTLIPEVSGE